MIRRDNRGQIISSTRHINTRVHAELLVGDGWEGVAYAELMRLSLEVATYHNQLEGKPGHEETGQAVEALKAAYKTLNDAYTSGDEEGLDLHITPRRPRGYRD